MTSKKYNALWWSAVGPTCQNFRLNGLLTDLTLIVNKCNRFKVHKLILACASGYFENCAKEKKLKDVYYLDNINESDFQALLHFMYGESLLLDDRNVHGILAAAKALQFDSALQHCQDFLYHLMHKQEVSITDQMLSEAPYHQDNFDSARISSTFIVSPPVKQNLSDNSIKRNITAEQDEIKFDDQFNQEISIDFSSQKILQHHSHSSFVDPQGDNSFASYQTISSPHDHSMSSGDHGQHLSTFPSSSNYIVGSTQQSCVKSRSESPDLIIIGSQDSNVANISSTNMSLARTYNPSNISPESYLLNFDCHRSNLGSMSMKSRMLHLAQSSQTKPHVCEICSFSTKYPQRLRLHRRLVHTHQGVKPFKCPYCNYQASIKSNCRKHVKNIHPMRDIEVITLFQIP